MTAARAIASDPVLVGTGRNAERTVERLVERRIAVIWSLLFFNVLGSLPGPTILPIPRSAAQGLTGLALAIALVLALGLNRRTVIRPNVVLGLTTILAILAMMTSIRLVAGQGAVVRSARLLACLAVLWLLTPWWGRRDMLLLRCHMRALVAVSVSVLIGLVLSPGKALSGAGAGRLVDVLWAIPAPQVAEYAAIAAGVAMVLWMSGSMRRGPALLIGATGFGIIVFSQTRTAMIGLSAGLLCASLSLLLARRRVRRLLSVILLVLPLATAALAPTASAWFTRNQSSEQIGGLTGRKAVWDALLAKPRPEFNRWFGFGLSDKSFNGLSIDSTWLAVYQDQGLVGDALVGAVLLFLLIAQAFRPPGPARAVAIFLVVYTAVASYTEVTFGDASPYLLSIVVAASLLVPEGVDDPMPGENGQ